MLHSIGSKAALSILPAALINPGDYVLMTMPGYPVFGTHAKYLGGRVHNLPLTEENQFLPDLDAVPAEVLKQAKVLVLNYPNNPTGASATPEFFARVVEFARKHRLVVIHDAAYAALVFEGRPLSFLATPGREGGGHRTALGEQVLQHDRLAVRVRGGQRAAGAGLRGCEGQHRLRPVPGDPARRGAWLRPSRRSPQQIAAKYSRRMDGLVEVLAGAGFQARKPKGSFFLYVKAPKAAREEGRQAHCVPERRGGLAVAHHREADLHRAVG